MERYEIEGLGITVDDLIASIRSNHVLVRIVDKNGKFFCFKVDSLKQLVGYQDFWHAHGTVGNCCTYGYADLFIDFHEPEAAGHPPGGFGYFETTPVDFTKPEAKGAL